jgi:hypothetical protein
VDDASTELGALYEAMVIDDELAATDQFMLTSIRLLGRIGFLGRDEYVVTALLAAGAEKLLKLTIGFIRTDIERGPWPSTEITRFGHHIPLLDETARRLIRKYTSRASDPLALAGLQDRLGKDPYIGDILALVGDYAAGGRFYNLDYLGGPDETRRSPRMRWNEIFNTVWARHLDDQLQWGEMSSYADVSATDARNRRLQASVSAWRDFYLTAWGHGICGRRAQVLAENITDANPDW